MDRKKSKYSSETNFWAFGSLKAEKTRGAIMAPPHVDTLIQIPCGIGLSSFFFPFESEILESFASTAAL